MATLQRHSLHCAGLLTVLLLSAFVTVRICAEPEGPAYQLTRWTLGNGGHTRLAKGNYILAATVGQSDVGTLSATSYGLDGGFWAGRRTAPPETVFLPLVLRSG